jgi:hypothetical protein
MKFTFVLAIAAGMLPASFVAAQGLDFGLKAGVNGVKMEGVPFDESFRYGFVGGGFLHANFSKKFGVGAELLFSEATVKTAGALGDIGEGMSINDITDIKLNYLGIPLSLHYGNKFKLQGGVQFNIKTNEETKLGGSIKNAFSNNDIQALAGFHWNLPLHLFISGRYLVGLTNQNELTANGKWKSQMVQVTTGLRF